MPSSPRKIQRRRGGCVHRRLPAAPPRRALRFHHVAFSTRPGLRCDAAGLRRPTAPRWCSITASSAASPGPEPGNGRTSLADAINTAIVEPLRDGGPARRRISPRRVRETGSAEPAASPVAPAWRPPAARDRSAPPAKSAGSRAPPAAARPQTAGSFPLPAGPRPRPSAGSARAGPADPPSRRGSFVAPPLPQPCEVTTDASGVVNSADNA